jgi:sec-independent protein translocase protein TatB
MFDIGFSELLVIAIVALVVIGPERLPKVARTLGLLFGRFQRYVAEVKNSVEQEIHADDLRKLQSDFQQGINSVNQTIHKEVGSVGAAIESTKTEVRDQLVFADEAHAEKPSNPTPSPTVEPEPSKDQLELDLDSLTDKHHSS